MDATRQREPHQHCSQKGGPNQATTRQCMLRLGTDLAEMRFHLHCAKVFAAWGIEDRSRGSCCRGRMTCTASTSPRYPSPAGQRQLYHHHIAVTNCAVESGAQRSNVALASWPAFGMSENVQRCPPDGCGARLPRSAGDPGDPMKCSTNALRSDMRCIVRHTAQVFSEGKVVEVSALRVVARTASVCSSPPTRDFLALACVLPLPRRLSFFCFSYMCHAVSNKENSKVPRC